jgi:hypothetical protein
MNNEFMNERLSLERRLMIVEKIAQESLETIKHSQEILNQSILSHPTIQSLSNALKDSLQFQQEFSLLKDELRNLSNEYLKLSSQQINLTDFLFFKEKLLKCDLIINEKLPEYFESTKKLLDFHSVVTNKNEHYDILLQHLNLDMTSLSNKAESMNLLTIQLNGNLSTNNEEMKIVKNRLTALEQSLQKDINILKDLNGSLASKLQSQENKLTTMNRTQSSETQNILQQIKFFEEKLAFYEKHIQSVQRMPMLAQELAQQQQQISLEGTSNNNNNLSSLARNNNNINVAPLALLSTTIPLSGSSASSMTTTTTTAVPAIVKKEEHQQPSQQQPHTTSSTSSSSLPVRQTAPVIPPLSFTHQKEEPVAMTVKKEEEETKKQLAIKEMEKSKKEEVEEDNDEIQPFEQSFEQEEL